VNRSTRSDVFEMEAVPARARLRRALAGKDIAETNPYQAPSVDIPALADAVPKYARSRFGLLLAALGMFGHLVLMVLMAPGWLVCIRPFIGLQQRNTPAPSTPLEWCVSAFMCILWVHAARIGLAETKTFKTFTRSQERFRSISMAAFSVAPVILGALTLDPYPAMTIPSARTFFETTLLSGCWLGFAWLRFRQMNAAQLAC